MHDTQNTLENLDHSLKWELRSLYVVLVGVGVHALGSIFEDPESQSSIQDRGLQLLEYAVLWIMIMDASFSIIVTALFVLPIYETLRESGSSNAVSATREYTNIQKSMYMTLFGSTLAVLSSTLLYFNLLVYFRDPSLLRDDSYLNPLVFGGNLDSILNNVGMLFVCGMFKYMSPLATVSNAITKTSKADTHHGKISAIDVSSSPHSYEYDASEGND